MDGKAESSPKSTGSFDPPARTNRGSPVAEDRRKDFLVLHRPARFVCLIPLNRVDITGVPSGRLFCNRPQGHSHRHKTDPGHHSQHRKKVSIDHFASLRHCTKSNGSSVIAGLWSAPHRVQASILGSQAAIGNFGSWQASKQSWSSFLSSFSKASNTFAVGTP